MEKKVLFIKLGDKESLKKIAESDYVFREVESNKYQLIKSRNADILDKDVFYILKGL